MGCVHGNCFRVRHEGFQNADLTEENKAETSKSRTKGRKRTEIKQEQIVQFVRRVVGAAKHEHEATKARARVFVARARLPGALNHGARVRVEVKAKQLVGELGYAHRKEAGWRKRHAGEKESETEWHMQCTREKIENETDKRNIIPSVQSRTKTKCTRVGKRNSATEHT